MSHPPTPTLAAIGRLFTAVTIALLAAAALILTLASPARPALAYPVTPDGNAGDWVMAPPPSPNLGHIGRNLAGQGEYVWRDAAGDESAAFASPDPGVDLLEFRLTADRDNLYFTAVLSNVTIASGQNAPQIQIAIDTDQQPGSGGAYLESGNTVSVTANAYWEYLLATPFGSGGSQMLVYSGGSFTSPSAAGAAILNPAANTIEAAVPWAALGQSGPPATPLRFTVGLCRAETDNSCRSAGAAPRILDAITNYGDPGLSANTTAETGDNVLDYPFDLFFEPDGDVYPPLRFSELYYDAVGADSDNEWLEIYNAAPISLSLDGVKLGDEETPDGSEGMVQLPNGYTIQPGEALIVAQTTGNITTSGFLWLYGFLPDFEINNSNGSVPDTSPYANWGTNNVALGNGGDQALLLDAASTILDVVIYESATWPGVSSPVTAPTGSSIERAPASQDSNDVATDFIIQPSSGTPGLALLPPTNLAPPRHAITASRNSVVSAQVGDQLDAATVTSRTFVLHGGQSGLITATHTAVNDNLIITPNRPFFQGESVFAIVTNGPRNAAGQQVAAPAQWQFTAGVLAPRCADPSFDSAASANLLNTGESSAAWGDYDNDGDLDILLTGRDSSNTPRALIYQNQAGVFITDTVASANLTGLSGDSAAWGDYDNDGDLDILLTGRDGGGAPRARLYRNQNGVFIFDTAASANLTGVDSGRAVWGDYNNDGNLDILLTGSDSGGTPRAQVYQNQSNIFTLVSAASANLTGLDNSSAAWGDYDNDGDLDILLTGLDSSGAPRALLYENQAGLFITDTAASANLTGVSESSAAWGDYDNDGDLDILLAGSDNGGAPRALIYENRGGLFITATAASANLTGVNMGAAAWGDYDNDNDLDILLTGLDSGANPTARLYRNNDCLPDLVVSKTAAPEPAVAGMPLTYTINVTNAGTLTATGVTISDTLPPSLTLRFMDQTDDADDALGFGGGVHQNTQWVDPRPGVPGEERLELSDPALYPNGVFTSRVMDGGNVGAWTALEWLPRRPYWKPLPDNGAAEYGYDFGNVNMGGNRLLLHLDETAGATSFADSSGLGNNGVCPAAPGENCPTAGSGGRFNTALSFDGALSQTVVISETYDPARYAIELWVNPAVVTDTAFILRTDAISGTAVNYSALLGIQDGRFVHLVNDGQLKMITSTTPVVAGNWYHLVGTAESGGDIKLFVNGVEEARLNGIGQLWAGGDQYRLGSAYGSSATYFTGVLDEAAVYSRTLSAGEALDHYLRGALRLSFQARSCDDPACAGDSFAPTLYSEQGNSGLAPAGAALTGIPDNRYFQYRAFFASDNPAWSPQLRAVSALPGHRQVLASQGSCQAQAQVFTCTTAALPPGGFLTVTAYANVDPAALGVITNSVTVSAANETSPGNNSAFVTTTIRSETRLNVAKEDEAYGGSDPVNPGSVLTYTLAVHNDGPSAAWSVVVTDQLPITVTGVITPTGWNCAYAGNGVTCTTPSLAPGPYANIVITGAAPASTGFITNTGWITASGSLVYASSRLSGTERTLITPLADLAIAKSGLPDPVDPGGALTYTVVVTNSGPMTATGVVVTDTINPAGYASAPGWSCAPAAGQTLVCALAGDLPPGASASFQITTTAPLTGIVMNRAEVRSDLYDPDETNNVAYAHVGVRPVADLHLVKMGQPDQAPVGAPLTYTLAVSNSGYVDAGALRSTVTVTNNQTINVPWGGRAAPYPAPLYVGGMPGVIRNLTVTLSSLNHTYPADLNLLLVGPDGRNAILMAGAGGGVDVNSTLTLNDSGQMMPVNGTLTNTTVYRPTNYGLPGDLPPGAPPGPYGGSLSTFYGRSPNGVWRLYVYDSFPSDGGALAGWRLQITTVTTDTVTVSDTLPAGVSNVSVALPPGWQQTGSNPLTFVADTLPVGTTEQFTITVNAPLTSGVITNTAAISSTTADFWPGSNRDAVTTTILPGTSYLYLPVVLNNYATAPDLVVENIVATSNSITVTIRNQGAATIEALVENEFWVDLYVAPNPAPTQVNQVWPNLSSQGAVWGVTVSGLPLPPGGVITLTTGGPYYAANLSQITWPLSPGTPIYVQVDSAHAQTTYGGILENHEITGGAYNNISGPVLVTAAAGNGPPAAPAASAASRRYLPPRPQNWR